MTDPALSMTQSVVSAFAKRYLETIGGTVSVDEELWQVTMPEHLDTELPAGQMEILCGTSEDTNTDHDAQLHPESAFFQTLLEDAIERSPVAKLTVESQSTQVEIPAWLQQGDLAVENVSFRPLYDRNAVGLFYRVAVETVSAYQTEFLRATAVDLRSMEQLPGIRDRLLELSREVGSEQQVSPVSFDQETAESVIKTTREQILVETRSEIEQINQEASRAADVELEEYRQLQEQTLEELTQERDSLSNRVGDLTDRIEGSIGQAARVEALQERKELSGEIDEIETRVSDIRDRRERGFPETQREIRDRHGLEVVITPLSMTQMTYERGEAEFQIRRDDASKTLTLGYGVGVGVTETVSCGKCGTDISESNPIHHIHPVLRCVDCSDQIS